MSNFLNKIISNLWKNPESGNAIIHLKELDNINRKYFDMENNEQINKNDGFLAKFFGWFVDEKYGGQKIVDNSVNSKLKNVKLDDSCLISNISIIENNKSTNTLEKYNIDPLGIFVMIILGFFIYIYFASDFFCQIIGLFYPIYKLYLLVDNDILNALAIKSIMNYFVVFGHIEILSLAFKIFGLYFYHLKILIICFMLYLQEYRQDWLNGIFHKIIFYDKIICGLSKSGIKIISKEYNNIHTNVLTNEDKKKK